MINLIKRLRFIFLALFLITPIYFINTVSSDLFGSFVHVFVLPALLCAVFISIFYYLDSKHYHYSNKLISIFVFFLPIIFIPYYFHKTRRNKIAIFYSILFISAVISVFLTFSKQLDKLYTSRNHAEHIAIHITHKLCSHENYYHDTKPACIKKTSEKALSCAHKYQDYNFSANVLFALISRCTIEHTLKYFTLSNVKK